MGEKESEPFQFAFNGFLKVAFQGSRVTSDAGLVLVRELDERLEVSAALRSHRFGDPISRNVGSPSKDPSGGPNCDARHDATDILRRDPYGEES